MANQYLYDLTDTWNNVATTFDAIKINVTDTNSAAGSKLLNLQVGASPKFTVQKDGAVALTGAVTGATSITMNGALSGATTVGMNGALTGATDVTASGTVTADRMTITKTGLNAPAISSTGYSLTGSNATSLVDLAGTWNTTGTPTAIKLNITESSTPNTASLLFDLQRGSSSQFSVRRDGRATCQSLNVIGDISINGTAVTVSNFWVGLLNTGSLRASTTEARLDGGTHLGWSAGTNTVAADTRMWRDGAAGAIGLRDASTAHTLNIYNTYSSSTSYERLSIIAQSAAAVQIVTNKGSAGGSARALELGTDGTTRLTIGTTGNLTSTGSFNVAQDTYYGLSSGPHDLYVGSSGILGMRSTKDMVVILDSNNDSTDANFSVRKNNAAFGSATTVFNVNEGGYVEMFEQTAPAAPAADTVRIYAEDNGSGKTRLMALFPSGVAQQIAIEP